MRNLLHNGKADLPSANIEYRAEQHWVIYVLPIFYVVVGIVGILPAILGLAHYV